MILGEFLDSDEALQKYLLRATYPRVALQGPAAKMWGLTLVPLAPGFSCAGLACGKHPIHSGVTTTF